MAGQVKFPKIVGSETKFNWIDDTSKAGNDYQGLEVCVTCDDGTEYRCYQHTPANSPHKVYGKGAGSRGTEAIVE
jgi:hypothetical protein